MHPQPFHTNVCQTVFACKPVSNPTKTFIFLHHSKKQQVHDEPRSTRSEDTMSIFQICLSRPSDEEMENTQQTTRSSGFFAVLLRRDHVDAEEVEVLIPSDVYFTFPGPGATELGIVQAAHLGKATRAAAA